MNESDLCALRTKVLDLELENACLRREIEFLKTHPSITQGMKGELLVSKVIDGTLTSYAEGFDFQTAGGKKIEVKFSKLNRPMPNSTTPTRRWTWSKPLGFLDKGKDYDYLLLIGDKDERYLDQYRDDTPYIYFLIPLSRVRDVMNSGSSIGGSINLTSNLMKLQRKRQKPKLLEFWINFDQLSPLLQTEDKT